MNMNAFNTLRLLKLLSGGVSPQDEPVHSPGYGDPSTELPNPSGFGDPNLDNLPNPRFSGGPDGNDLTPGEKNIPFGGPKPPNPDEQRIRDLYSKEPAGMAAYRAYLANAPTHDKYEASTGRKIFAALAGIGTELSNHALARRGVSGGSSGMDVTNSIIDEPYNDALKDWTIKGKGLGAVAALDEKQQYGQMKAEEAIGKNREIASRNAATQQAKQAALDEKVREADMKHEEEISKAKTAEERFQANENYRQKVFAFNAEAKIEGLNIRKDSLQFRKDTSHETVQSPDNPAANIIVNKLTRQKVGDAPLAGADRTKVSTANEVDKAVETVKSLFTPDIQSKIGSLKGKAQDEWIQHGFSDDHDLQLFARELDTLEKKHAAIAGNSRVSLALIKDIRKSMGTLGQNPSGIFASLEAMKASAKNTKDARTPGKFTEKKLSSGKVIQVEE